MIDRDTRHQLIDFFTPLFEDERQRKAIVDLALGDAPVRCQIQWGGAPRLFATELVTLSADIEVAPGEPALLALLEECRPYVGNEQWPQLEQLCRAVRPAQTPPAWSGSPYPGLSPFTREQAPIFFGRARETRALVRELAAGKRFLCVVGASGSGKSSLVAAGLLPALDRDAIPGGSRWLAVRCVPGKGGDPFLALAFALDPLLDSAGYRPEQVAEELASYPRRLDAVAEAALRTQGAGAELLLWVDQMEELFSLIKAPAAVTAFIDFLDYASRHEHVRVVATLRADFYAACLDYEILSERLRGGSFPLSAPGPAALYQMITGPAELADLALAEGLPERLAADAGADPGSLPLLAFTLDELYQARTGKQLTLAAYEALGGVRGAIGRRAEQVFEALSEAARAALPAVFRELVTVSDDGVATRRWAVRGEVAASPGAQELVTAFSGAKARLLVGDRDIHDRPMVEVANEALFSAWLPLSRWLDERRDDLRLRRQIEAAALEWRRCGRDPAHLWPHERLAPVYQMLDRLDLQTRLEEPVKSFVRSEAERLLEEIQAARSGKQNIIEGSMASATSKETEIKLTNVARASLEELLADYRDFLRIRGLAEWPRDHPYARRLSELIRTPNSNYETFKKGLEHSDPAIAANVIIGLIKVASYLLDRQLRQLEKAFVEEGGLRERMTRSRLKERARQAAMKPRNNSGGRKP